MTEKQKTVYVAMDGEEFDSKEECSAYEAEVKDIHIYTISFTPDTNEGKGFYKTIRILSDLSNACMEHICYKCFGSKWTFVQGIESANTITENWSLHEIKFDAKEFDVNLLLFSPPISDKIVAARRKHNDVLIWDNNYEAIRNAVNDNSKAIRGY